MHKYTSLLLYHSGITFHVIYIIKFINQVTLFEEKESRCIEGERERERGRGRGGEGAARARAFAHTLSLTHSLSLLAHTLVLVVVQCARWQEEAGKSCASKATALLLGYARIHGTTGGRYDRGGNGREKSAGATPRVPFPEADSSVDLKVWRR